MYGLTTVKLRECFETMDNEEVRGIRLLGDLESILHRDPLINEVGFVHSSQLATFHPLEDEDPIASFGGDMKKYTVGRRNIGIAFQTSFFEGVSGKSKFPLAEEGDTKASRELSYDRSVFWSGDHKLAISVQALFPLYKTAKAAYLSAYQRYKHLLGSTQIEHHLPYVCEPEGSSKTAGENRHTLDIEAVENELMNHSQVLVLLSCDYASAWNSRKRVISQKPLREAYCAELQLSALVIFYAPKSEQAWSYRYWLIRLIINGALNLKEVYLILESESDFVERIVERSHLNYRAWRHRCRLVNHMPKPLVLNELHRKKKWAESHVGDNCCFHYRRCLLQQLHQMVSDIVKVDIDISPIFLNRIIHNDTKGDGEKLLLIWKEELDWNKNLIRRYFGRETLWIHRRFLFHEMIQQAEAGFHYSHTSFATHWDMGVPKHGQSHQPVPLDFFLFIEQEFEFIDLCMDKPDNIFEDDSKQKEYAAMYGMWMILHLRQVNGSQELSERIEKEEIELKVMVENVCPQRTLLWDEILSA